MRRSRETQSGYALLGALFVVISCAGVALAALTSMTISSSQTNSRQSFTARDVRAADNALESAINEIRMDPAGELGNVDTCISPTDYASNARVVTVSATCEESTQAMPADPNQNATAPAVRLVGRDGYRSATAFGENVLWSNDCARGNTALTSCAPWSLGLGLPMYNSHAATTLSAARPSLVHSSGLSAASGGSSKTLGFAADVFAHRGSATMIDPSEASPAVQVAGRYEQGDAGLFNAQGGGQCGVTGNSHPWNVLAARIVDANDAAGSPTCGSDGTDARNQAERMELGVRPAVPTVVGTVPALCPAGNVITFTPGRYGKVETARLNQMLGGQCPNKTYWFQPQSSTEAGTYWFDVDNPVNPDGSAKPRDLWNSLIISDPTVRVIFGTPTDGSSPSAAASSRFPQACNAASYGVEILLSPRTTIRHLDGKVAICDRDANTSTSTAPAAIWQAGNADGGWRGFADTATSQSTLSWRTTGGQFCLFFGLWCFDVASGNAYFRDGSAGLAWRQDGQYARARFECSASLGRGCVMDASFRGRGFGLTNPDGSAGLAAAPGPMESLDVVVRARSENRDQVWSLINDGAVGTTIRFYRPGVSTAACGAYFPHGPDPLGASQALTLSFDLLSPAAQSVSGLQRCGDIGLNRSELQGSGVDVNFGFVRTYAVSNSGIVDVEVDSIELRSGWDLQPSASTGGAGWGSAQNLLPATGAITATDGSHSGFTLRCGVWWLNCPTETRHVDLTGFENHRTPWVPTSGALSAAGLVVTGETTTREFFEGGSFYDIDGNPDIDEASNLTAVISNLRGTTATCTATWSKVPFWGQGLYLDLLDPNVAGSCSTVLTSAEQLQGASVRLSAYVDRDGSGNGNVTAVDYGVRIDSVRISTVTAGEYTRPRAPAVMTFGNGAASSPSSFNVFGQVSMPRNDLTVRWNGPAPVDDQGDPVPLGGGNMVLSGLGSFVSPTGTAGVICCSPTKPAERIVNLTATLPTSSGPRVGGTARIRVNDVGGPGSNLVIDEWSLS